MEVERNSGNGTLKVNLQNSPDPQDALPASFDTKVQLSIHIVISMNSKSNICTIVTAYEPSPELWENDFKTKKKRK